MAYVPPIDWKDYNEETGVGDPSTPLSATNVETMEAALAAYSESVAAGGIELGYAAITSTVTKTTLYSAVLDGTGDVTGLSTTVTVASRPIMVKFSCPGGVNNNTATTSTLVSILEDGVEVCFARLDQHATASERDPMHFECRRAPSAGLHTYKIVLTTLAAGTAGINAGASSPTFIQVLEV